MVDDPTTCLGCTLPECDEGDPGCLRRQVRRSSPWAACFEQVAALGSGGCARFESMDATTTDRLQSALLYAAQRGRLPAIRTRRMPQELHGLYDLEVWRAAPVRGRRWSRWTEQTDQVQALDLECERAFPLPTEEAADSLQKAILALHRKGAGRFTTWRVTARDRLVLHVRRDA